MNEYIKDELGEISEEIENKNFKVTDISSANQAFRRLSALKCEKSEIETLARNEKDRIEEWETKKTGQADRYIAYYENAIKEYYLTEKDNNPKFKLSTPYGVVTSRLNTDWQYDEEILLEELKGSEFIKTKTTESVDKIALRKSVTIFDDGKVVTSDGVILEGVTATKKQSVSVKPAEGYSF